MIEAAFSGVLAAAVSTLGLYFSAKAAKNSKPVSNGFADHVIGSLDRIEARLDRHLENHK